MLCEAHANCQTWDTDQLVCSWIADSVLSAQQFDFSVLWAVVRANWVLLWLKMLHKLRQMALIQTRVIQKEEGRLALQSEVRLGHRPALHLLVFSKAHVQQLCCCQVTNGEKKKKAKKKKHGVLLVEDGRWGCCYPPPSCLLGLAVRAEWINRIDRSSLCLKWHFSQLWCLKG